MFSNSSNSVASIAQARVDKEPLAATTSTTRLSSASAIGAVGDATGDCTASGTG